MSEIGYQISLEFTLFTICIAHVRSSYVKCISKLAFVLDNRHSLLKQKNQVAHLPGNKTRVGSKDFTDSSSNTGMTGA